MIINFNKTLFNKKFIKLITEAYNYALTLLKVPCKDIEVNIDFVSTKRILELNRNFRNNDKVTDVLSFPNLLKEGVENEQIICDILTKENFAGDINYENNCIFLGDICICKKVVFRQAKEFGNSREREMAYMAVHGLLHLLGYDHMREEDKTNMRTIEEKIMKHVKLERE
jgi:probable rRNA maturation factor